jgi:hypothetical protein
VDPSRRGRRRRRAAVGLESRAILVHPPDVVDDRVVAREAVLRDLPSRPELALAPPSSGDDDDRRRRLRPPPSRESRIVLRRRRVDDVEPSRVRVLDVVVVRSAMPSPIARAGSTGRWTRGHRRRSRRRCRGGRDDDDDDDDEEDHIRRERQGHPAAGTVRDADLTARRIHPPPSPPPQGFLLTCIRSGLPRIEDGVAPSHRGYPPRAEVGRYIIF